MVIIVPESPREIGKTENVLHTEGQGNKTGHIHLPAPKRNWKNNKAASRTRNL